MSTDVDETSPPAPRLRVPSVHEKKKSASLGQVHEGDLRPAETRREHCRTLPNGSSRLLPHRRACVYVTPHNVSTEKALQITDVASISDQLNTRSTTRVCPSSSSAD